MHASLLRKLIHNTQLTCMQDFVLLMRMTLYSACDNVYFQLSHPAIAIVQLLIEPLVYCSTSDRTDLNAKLGIFDMSQPFLPPLHCATLPLSRS